MGDQEPVSGVREEEGRKIVERQRRIAEIDEEGLIGGSGGSPLMGTTEYSGTRASRAAST